MEEYENAKNHPDPNTSKMTDSSFIQVMPAPANGSLPNQDFHDGEKQNIGETPQPPIGYEPFDTGPKPVPAQELMAPYYPPLVVPMQQQTPGMSLPMMPIPEEVGVAEGIIKDKTGKGTLAALSSIFIKQKPQYLEALTGCEFENVYYVYKLVREQGFLNEQKEVKVKTKKEKIKPQGEVIFKCKEVSGCCERNFMGGSCRPFTMDVMRRTISNGKKRNEPFLILKRPCVCTCYCLNRPYIDVIWINGKKEVALGKVTEPWSCLDLIMDIYKADNPDKPLYSITTSCCQCGLMFQCPIKGCNEVLFQITDSNTQKPAGNIKKEFGGTLQEFLTNADNYTADFPIHADWEAKALLLAATLFIDYRFFEDKGAQPTQRVQPQY